MKWQDEKRKCGQVDPEDLAFDLHVEPCAAGEVSTMALAFVCDSDHVCTHSIFLKRCIHICTYVYVYMYICIYTRTRMLYTYTHQARIETPVPMANGPLRLRAAFKPEAPNNGLTVPVELHVALH